MRCTGKEQLTCNEEKMGCEGCYYNDDKNKDEIKVWDYLKVLEQLIEEHKKLGDTSEETRISQPLFELIIQAIENLIARNKELEKLSENIKMFRDNNLSSEIDYVIALKSNFMEYLKTDYISKSKAEELLKRLDKEEKEKLKGIKGQDRYFIKQIYQAKRSAIEELLQEGNK